MQEVDDAVFVKKIEKYYERAYHKMEDILVSKYGISRIDAETLMSRQLDELIMPSMQSYHLPEFIKEYENIYLNEYIYFNAWMFYVMVIPMYQSLGDTIGYNNGKWEFNRGQQNMGPEYANDMIYEYISLGGINDMSITNWHASDDTILYMATIHVLSDHIVTIDEYGTKLQKAYIDTLPTITDRAPGETTMRSLNIQKFIKWDKLPYDKDAVGSGASMRSGAIGIFYPGRPNRKRLIALAIETSRITHNSATAMLGSITSALFTAYAIERVPVAHWPHKLLKLIQSTKIDEYLEKSRPDEYKDYVRDKVIFYGQWEKYIRKRFSGLTPLLDIKIFKHPVARSKYFAENHSKGHMDNPGGCSDDSVIMAYDALLESGPSLEKLIVYSILHYGDSDTVGSIALSWFGAVYNSLKNYRMVDKLFKELEYYKELKGLFLTKNVQDKMLKAYYHDMYIHYGRKLPIKKILSADTKKLSRSPSQI